MSSNVKYQYKSLGPRQIRLCKFNTSENDSRIACTLEHHSIDDPPEYTCLSYCWGNDKERHNICIGNQEAVVMPNLYSFLKLYAGADEYIWIDQICIDQSAPEGENSEKTLQVKMMSDIYERASQVRVWLGEVADGSHIAFGCLRQLLYSVNQGGEYSPSALDRVALVKLLNREYWRRVWIVQELYLGNNLIFSCGGDTLAWNGPYDGNQERLMSAVILEPYRSSIVHGHINEGLETCRDILETDRNSFLECLDGTAVEVWHQACTALNILVFCGWKAGRDRPKLSLTDALASYQKSNCSINCDKIYGFLASVKEEQRIEVDYKKCIEDLYHETVTEMAKWANIDYTRINFRVCMTAGQMAGPLGFNFKAAMLAEVMDRAVVEIQAEDKNHVAYEWLLGNTIWVPDASNNLKQRWVSFLLHLPWSSAQTPTTDHE